MEGINMVKVLFFIVLFMLLAATAFITELYLRLRDSEKNIKNLKRRMSEFEEKFNELSWQVTTLHDNTAWWEDDLK